MWQEKFAKKFNQNFGEPFLPKEFAKAEVREGGIDGSILHIRIGDRDADFDADGKCVGGGMALGPCANWPLEPLIKEDKVT